MKFLKYEHTIQKPNDCKLGWFKYVRNAKIKNHPNSALAMTSNDESDVVRLGPSSKPRELEPFQNKGMQCIRTKFSKCSNHLEIEILL